MICCFVIVVIVSMVVKFFVKLVIKKIVKFEVFEKENVVLFLRSLI